MDYLELKILSTPLQILTESSDITNILPTFWRFNPEKRHSRCYEVHGLEHFSPQSNVK